MTEAAPDPSHPGVRRQRPYLFYSSTEALCGTCLRRVQAKEVIEGERVYLLKRCPEHGAERVLLADDATYWRWAREEFLKPPDQPARFNTPHRYGCPYDCGVCPEHEQHACLTLLEITDHCALTCPACFSSSGPQRKPHRSMQTIHRMLDRICANEIEPDIVQVSGGEPTAHPHLFEILDECKRRPIRHLMLNTNGVRIAKEAGFAERLATYAPAFEVYLQFDSLDKDTLVALRGEDLREIRERALDRLDEVGLSTTLVVVVRGGVNDDQLGEIIRYAITRKCVRGVSFQLEQDAGRGGGFDAAENRVTLTEVRRKILEQQEIFSAQDLIPVPCHPDCLAMAYAVRDGGSLTPLTRLIPHDVLLDAGNTVAFERDARLREQMIQTFSLGHGPESASKALSELLCCLPRVSASDARYDQVFRITIISFLDRHNLETRSLRKACIFIAHPDGKRIIPFDTYNILYRGTLERDVLQPLRSGGSTLDFIPASRLLSIAPSE